jgi:hypothetical protein
VESFLDTRTKYIIYTSFIGVLGVLSCSATYFFDYRESTSDLQLSRQATSIVLENISGAPGAAVPSSRNRTIIIEMPDFDDIAPASSK